MAPVDQPAQELVIGRKPSRGGDGLENDQPDCGTRQPGADPTSNTDLGRAL